MKKLITAMKKLEKILAGMGSVLVAFSGGADSAFLLKVTHDILGPKAMAATALSPIWPSPEFEVAKEYASHVGIKHIALDFFDILNNEDFTNNPPNRCYICKKAFFGRLKEIAREHNLSYVIDGTHYSDAFEHRPGMKAAQELHVRSPLYEAKLTKDDIRKLAREMNLPQWDKPSSSCLATRFPYGTKITKAGLGLISEGEDFLRGLGLVQVRLRHHDDTARIEVDPAQIDLLINGNLRKKIVNRFKEFGYTYVTLDLEGYRSGSMDARKVRKVS